MIDPGLYAQINAFQRKQALQCLEQFKDKLKWKQLEGDTLIDIGCGPGDVTIDYVFPALSDKFQKLVATDISTEMLEYANEKYKNIDPRIEFGILDIGDENLKIREQFDHLTSFFCLNFPKNQRQCLKNVYDLLKPGGDGVVVLMTGTNFYVLFEALMDDPKWAPHLTDMTRFISQYYRTEDPLVVFKDYLEKAGFKNSICQFKEEVHIVNLEKFNLYHQMIDYLKPTSQHMVDEFNKDLLEISRKIKMAHDSKDEVYLSYGVIAAYIKKD